jgi:hypothetical protein
MGPVAGAIPTEHDMCRAGPSRDSALHITETGLTVERLAARSRSRSRVLFTDCNPDI